MISKLTSTQLILNNRETLVSGESTEPLKSNENGIGINILEV